MFQILGAEIEHEKNIGGPPQKTTSNPLLAYALPFFEERNRKNGAVSGSENARTRITSVECIRKRSPGTCPIFNREGLG